MDVKFANGSLIQSYSKSDNRIFKVIDSHFIYNKKSKYKWVLVKLIAGDVDEYSQHLCLVNPRKYHLFQGGFESSNPQLKEIEFPIEKGSYIMGSDRSYKRSIYKLKDIVMIPDMNCVGKLIELVSFDGRDLRKYKNTGISLEKYDLYKLSSKDKELLNV